MIRTVEAPTTRADSMYDSAITASTEPRITRAKAGA